MNQFDIIIWGATSFTGKLVTEYFFKNFDHKKLNGQLQEEIYQN